MYSRASAFFLGLFSQPNEEELNKDIDNMAQKCNPDSLCFRAYEMGKKASVSPEEYAALLPKLQELHGDERINGAMFLCRAFMKLPRPRKTEHFTPIQQEFQEFERLPPSYVHTYIKAWVCREPEDREFDDLKHVKEMLGHVQNKNIYCQGIAALSEMYAGSKDENLKDAFKQVREFTQNSEITKLPDFYETAVRYQAHILFRLSMRREGPESAPSFEEMEAWIKDAATDIENVQKGKSYDDALYDLAQAVSVMGFKELTHRINGLNKNASSDMRFTLASITTNMQDESMQTSPPKSPVKAPVQR